MEIIRTRSSINNYLSARRTAKLRCKRGSLDAKFLQFFYRNQATGSTQGTERLRRAGSRCSLALARCNTKVRGYPVNEKVIRACSLARDAELPGCRTDDGSDHNTGGQLEQGVEAAAVKWQAFHESVVDHRADCAILGIDQRRATLNRNRV